MLKPFDEEFAKIEADAATSALLPKINTLKAILGNRPLALYGGGLVLGFALQYCYRENLKPTCICDTYRPGLHETSGLPIVLPEQLLRDHPDALVLITTFQHEEQIMAHLLHLGFLSENICPFRFPTRISLNEFKEKYFHGYKWAYDFFKEDVSKKLVLNVARSFITSEILLPVGNQNDKYFDSEFIQLNNTEVFVDGGAYTGGTTESFIKRVNGSYKYLYAFEPHPDSSTKAIANLANYKNTDVIPKGLWNSKGKLLFQQNKYNPEDSSFVICLNDNKTINVSVICLDKFFSKKAGSELPTFIKLDVEGSEKEALLGATDSIKSRKPKLSVSVYHKAEDIYELPQIISDLHHD